MNKFIVTDKGIINTDQSSTIPLNSDRSVYEVIRLIDGVALFLEDHFQRLLSSARISGIELNWELSEFDRAIKTIMDVNGQNTGNIKFLLSTTNIIQQWSFSFIAHSYPTQKDYCEGVSAGSLYAERSNPEAKVIQSAVREKADQIIADQKLYEVLLVDRNGFITEGSRSNVFFVKDGVFQTAPASMVLSGVTRKKVLECLKELDYIVIEEAVFSHEISKYDAVFLTGTTPKILPVNAIDKHSFNVSHPKVKMLMDHYNRKINDYIESKKRLR